MLNPMTQPIEGDYVCILETGEVGKVVRLDPISVVEDKYYRIFVYVPDPSRSFWLLSNEVKVVWASD